METQTEEKTVGLKGENMLPSRREILQKFDHAGYELSSERYGYLALKDHALPIVIDGTAKDRKRWQFKVRDVDCRSIENAIKMSENSYDVWEGLKNNKKLFQGK